MIKGAIIKKPDKIGEKMSEIQKSLKFPFGGGVKPIWEFFPNFSVFIRYSSFSSKMPQRQDNAGAVRCLP